MSKIFIYFFKLNVVERIFDTKNNNQLKHFFFKFLMKHFSATFKHCELLRKISQMSCSCVNPANGDIFIYYSLLNLTMAF